MLTTIVYVDEYRDFSIAVKNDDLHKLDIPNDTPSIEVMDRVADLADGECINSLLLHYGIDPIYGGKYGD